MSRNPYIKQISDILSRDETVFATETHTNRLKLLTNKYFQSKQLSITEYMSVVEQILEAVKDVADDMIIIGQIHEDISKVVLDAVKKELEGLW